MLFDGRLGDRLGGRRLDGGYRSSAAARPSETGQNGEADE